jgi:hypothetical protein
MPFVSSLRAPVRAFLVLGAVLTVVTCASFAAPAEAHAQERDFGLGIIIGDPTGASGKFMLAREHGIDWAVGFGLIGGKDLSAHADYLWHLEIKRWPDLMLDLHLGAGPKLGAGNDKVFIGGRAPVGLSIWFLEAPFDVFVEVAAGLWIIEDVSLHIDGAIGGRYWF